MTIEHFQQLLKSAGLQCHQASRDYGIAFSVSLQVPTTFGTRYQVDWLVYQPAEFTQMTPEQAKRQVEACVKRLERAAKTKQGVVR